MDPEPNKREPITGDDRQNEKTRSGAARSDAEAAGRLDPDDPHVDSGVVSGPGVQGIGLSLVGTLIFVAAALVVAGLIYYIFFGSQGSVTPPR